MKKRLVILKCVFFIKRNNQEKYFLPIISVFCLFTTHSLTHTHSITNTIKNPLIAINHQSDNEEARESHSKTFNNKLDDKIEFHSFIILYAETYFASKTNNSKIYFQCKRNWSLFFLPNL